MAIAVLRVAGMNRVGEGIQYTAYDLGNGRIFKRPTTFLECGRRMLAWRYPFIELPIWTIPRDILRAKRDARTSLAGLRPLLPDLSLELGNPAINDDLSYEQDRAVAVGDYFRTHSLTQNKRAVDQYIVLLFRFWEYGFNDRPFKLPLNFGVTDDDRIILLDLGELYFEKEKALLRIHARLWEKVFIPDPALKAYYCKAMDRAMTPGNLDIYWARSLAGRKAGSGPAVGATPSLAT